MATIPERLKELETTQKFQEEEHSQIIESLSVRLDRAHALAQEAKDMAVQTNNSVEQMPSRIVEQIRKENRGFRMEFRDWVILLATLVMVVAAFWKH